MAGQTISLYLKEQGHHVVGFSRRSVSFLGDQIIGDACDKSLLERTVGDGGFDVIVNCIGVLNQFAERDYKRADYLNGQLPHLLAHLTEGIPARVFQMSTDCVFAGNTGPYTEMSPPDGESVYDRTKAEGELRDDKNLTFRCSIVGPDFNQNGIGLLNWFMKQKGAIKGYANAIWTGLTTLELAKAMECAAGEQVSGLVNMVPPESISKYELLCLFREHLRRDSIEIIPDAAYKMDKTLIRTNFESSFLPKSYEEQIKELAEWMRGHKSLYQCYGTAFFNEQHADYCASELN